MPPENIAITLRVANLRVDTAIEQMVSQNIPLHEACATIRFALGRPVDQPSRIMDSVFDLITAKDWENLPHRDRVQMLASYFDLERMARHL